MFPEREFIGAEGNPSVLYRALQKTAENGLANVHYIAEYVDDVRAYFGEGGLAGIYLNFSDPWPKDRHEKRRLTAAPRIAAYGEVVTQGGFVALKTDNEDFFEFSLEAFAAGGFETLHVTRDLHGAGELTGLPPEAQVMTEYEIKFTGIGKRIGYFLAVRP
jgi:tRNA (guanine-N7-)-methyltransferase